MATFETSIILAQFWGGLMVIACGLILIRKKALLGDMWGIVGNRAFTLLSGYIALSLGLITIILHNVWTFDWRMIVTVFGWVALIKGIMLIGFPGTFDNVTHKLKKNAMLTNTFLVVGLLLGAWLVWVSVL